MSLVWIVIVLAASSTTNKSASMLEYEAPPSVDYFQAKRMTPQPVLSIVTKSEVADQVRVFSDSLTLIEPLVKGVAGSVNLELESQSS